MTRDAAKSRRSDVELDQIKLSRLSTEQIRKLVHRGMSELLQRAVEAEDPDVLVAQAMQSMFSNGGEPLPPRMIATDIIGMAGTVRDTSSGKHVCSLYTIQLPNDGAPAWSWEPIGTLIHGDHEKVGQIRRSVSLHTAIDDMVIAKHDMMWNGERHIRTASRAWRVVSVDSGSELIPEASYTPTHLPPPHGEIDSRSSKAQN